jgi:hypothetical protein
MREPGDTLAVLRLKLRAGGYHPLPCEAKAPPMKGWQTKFDSSEAEIRLWDRSWHLATNTGLLTKFAPCVDIDITDPAAADAVEALAREHFEERGSVLVRFGQAPKRAILLRTDEPFPKLSHIFTAPNGGQHKIEVLGDGQQVVAFGIHPTTKQPYRWHGGSPAEIAREDLPYVRQDDAARFLDAAAALLVEQFGFTDSGGSRRKNATAAGGDDRQHDPFDWGEAFTRIYAGENLHDTVTALAASFIAVGMTDAAAIERLRSLMAASQTPKDARWRDRYDEIPLAVASARTKFAPSPAAVFDPWERYIVPAFPFEILPTVVQDFVATQATVIGCCPSATAMAALATFSGALHHGFAIKMLRDATWYEHVRLWILLVAEASQRKTPLLRTVSSPLVQYEKHLRENFEYALHAYHIAQEENEASQIAEPEPPPRYLAWDTTTEKLGEILARNGEKGILVLTDEISAWLGSMERYNNSGSRADRAFWLSAYDGGPRTVDRIKRGEQYIPNLSASILGGIQPARLAEIQGLTSDGLLQRFLPVMMGLAKFRQDRASEGAAYGTLVRELIFAKPARLIMTDDALAIMAELHQHLFDLEQSSEGLAAGFSSFVGKLHGLTGSLALILHLIQDPQLGASYPVGEQTIDNVRRLTLDFILPHAFEFYRGTGATEGDRLRRVASWILTSGKQHVLASDLTTNVRDLRGLTLLEVNERVSPLVAGGWLQPADKTPTCRAWAVAPQVHLQLAERAKSEAVRKNALATLIKSARKVPP